MKEQDSLGQWLKERCKREHLSLRQVAAMTGLSHSTIDHAIKGSHPSSETIRKLAQGFGRDGINQRVALEDKLLSLAGYRTERPEEELSEPLARLSDKLGQFSEPQLMIMEHFADYISEIEGGNDGC